MVSSAIIEQWEVNFARFVCFSSSSLTVADLTHPPSLTPHSEVSKKRRRGGVWISTPSATVKFISDCYNGSHDSVIMVTLGSKLMEEHYTLRLHVSWPQVSCLSGFPPRGTRAVILSYKDCEGQAQKFALRFSTLEQTEKFIDVMKVIMEGSEHPIAEFNSRPSSQSEFGPCSDFPYRDIEACKLSDSADIMSNYSQVTSNTKATDQSNAIATIPDYEVEDSILDFPLLDSADISTSNQVTSNSKAADESNAYATIPIGDADDFMSDFPPSFSSFLKNCCPPPVQKENRRTTLEVDFKSEFTKYLEDSSFQDLFLKVENVMNELGGRGGGDSILF